MQPSTTQSTPLTVSAEAHSDDYAVQVTFDATPYFVQASDETLRALIDCGFGGDYPADNVAEWTAEQPGDPQDVQRLFDYLATQRGTRNAPGFEVHVDSGQAEEWLKAHRPHLAAAE